MPYITQSSIQEVNDRLDAVAAVSDYVRLEKRGGRFWACCPFHQEKTASFTVNPDMKSYYCFGCHKGGSIINFIMEMDKLSFPEAIELLAKKVSVELQYENSSAGGNSSEEETRKQAKEALFELYHRIKGTFHYFLLEKPESEAGKHYIIDRGLNAEMTERFQLGYAPLDRFWLHNFLIKKGYSREFLATSGLFSPKHPGVSLFTGRLMFPISDKQGRTVAFGGRILPQIQNGDEADRGREAPKYMNSPELGIYKKRETLYGLDLAIPEIRRTKTAYIAEGYLDVIALHQAGICNALAPLGTAFTDEQAKLLRRWAEKVIIYFDSDRAGQDASVKGIYICKNNGLSCFIVTPESKYESKDPADILQNYGPESLQKAAKCFISDFEYLLRQAQSLYDSSGTGRQKSEGKARAVAFLFPYMSLLDSEVARTSCAETIADAFGLLPSAVYDDYSSYASGQNKGIQESREKPVEKEDAYRYVRMNDELSILVAVAVNYVSSAKEKFFTGFRTALEINEIDDPGAKEIFIALEECIRYGETGMDELLERVSSPDIKKLLVEKSVSGEFTVNAEKLVADGIRRIRCKRLERMQNEIIIRIRGLKSNAGDNKDIDDPNSPEVRDLLEEKMRIDNELYILEQGRQR